jgi:hypothetical protein
LLDCSKIFTFKANLVSDYSPYFFGEVGEDKLSIEIEDTDLDLLNSDLKNEKSTLAENSTTVRLGFEINFIAPPIFLETIFEFVKPIPMLGLLEISCYNLSSTISLSYSDPSFCKSSLFINNKVESGILIPLFYTVV